MGTIKKYQSGGKSSLGMKSVKAGFDKNPGITRADIIVAAKKQAKGGAKLKKQAAIAIAKKAAGKKPKKAQDGVFAPITVKKAKLDSVLNKRRASMDSTRAAFSRKLNSAKAKINAPKKKAMGGTKLGGKCRGGCY